MHAGPATRFLQRLVQGSHIETWWTSVLGTASGSGVISEGPGQQWPTGSVLPLVGCNSTSTFICTASRGKRRKGCKINIAHVLSQPHTKLEHGQQMQSLADTMHSWLTQYLLMTQQHWNTFPFQTFLLHICALMGEFTCTSVRACSVLWQAAAAVISLITLQESFVNNWAK